MRLNVSAYNIFDSNNVYRLNTANVESCIIMNADAQITPSTIQHHQIKVDSLRNNKSSLNDTTNCP